MKSENQIQLINRTEKLPKLVYEDLTGLKGTIENLLKIIDLSNVVAERYEELNIGIFTREIFRDVTQFGILNVHETYLSALKAEMKRLNIVNPTLRDSMVSGAKSALDPLREAINQLKRATRGTFGYYSLFEEAETASFENNRYCLSEQNIERIKDQYFRTFIITNEQNQVFINLQNLVDAYNTLVLSLEKINPVNAKLFKESAGNLLDYVGEVDGKLTVYKPNLNNLIYQTKANLV